MKASSSIRSVISGTGVILFDTNRGDTFGANTVGARIWQKLKQGTPVEQIVSEISAEFCVSPDIIQEDVQRFLDSLRKHELVQSS